MATTITKTLQALLFGAGLTLVSAAPVLAQTAGSIEAPQPIRSAPSYESNTSSELQQRAEVEVEVRSSLQSPSPLLQNGTVQVRISDDFVAHGFYPRTALTQIQSNSTEVPPQVVLPTLLTQGVFFALFDDSSQIGVYLDPAVVEQ